MKHSLQGYLKAVYFSDQVFSGQCKAEAQLHKAGAGRDVPMDLALPQSKALPLLADMGICMCLGSLPYLLGGRWLSTIF